MSEEKIPIFFAANTDYYQHLCVALVSLLENNPHREFDVRILTDDDDRESRNRILELIQHYHNVDIDFKKIELDDTERFFLRDENTPTSVQPHVTRQTYYRCFIPELSPEYDRAIYLDCDLLVEGNIVELWETDMGECYLAAVEDWGVNHVNPHYKTNIGFRDGEVYVNAGVLLMNLAAMRRDDIVNRLMTDLDKLGSRLTLHDQDLINHTLKGRIRFLESRFNRTTEYDHANLHDTVSPVISHFTTKRKPWSEQWICFHRARDRYFYYLEKTPYRDYIRQYRLKYYIRGVAPHYLKKLVKSLLPDMLLQRLRRAG